MAAARNALVRVVRAWGSLLPEQRTAAMASLALLVSMFFPWYEKNVAVRDGRIVNDSLSAFGVLSFIEAAIFLLSLGVLALLFFRAERRAFHLPGGDGTVVFGAGLWAAFLLLVRVFSRPEASGNGATVGIQWGFFLAFLAAGWLAYAGWRMRVAHRAEPTSAQDPTTKVEPVPATATPPPPLERLRTPTRPRRAGRTDATTAIAGQLSFEEGADEDEAPDRRAEPHDDVLPPPPRWEDLPRRRHDR